MNSLFSNLKLVTAALKCPGKKSLRYVALCIMICRCGERLLEYHFTAYGVHFFLPSDALTEGGGSSHTTDFSGEENVSGPGSDVGY